MINPNTKLWAEYHKTAVFRGELAAKLTGPECPLANARVLDLGCGSGGLCIAFLKHGSNVTAADPDADKIQQLNNKNIPGLQTQCVTAEALNVSNAYDIIILNDVLEHTLDPDRVLANCSRALVSGGVLYLVTPNRWSVINLFCDPHYSLPLVSLFPRKWTRCIVASVLHWHPKSKPDFPELLGRIKLEGLLKQHGFSFSYKNRQAMELALGEPRYIWSRNWHLWSVAMIKRFKIDKIMLTFVNNKTGLFNTIINPVWYITAKRK